MHQVHLTSLLTLSVAIPACLFESRPGAQDDGSTGSSAWTTGGHATHGGDSDDGEIKLDVASSVDLPTSDDCGNVLRGTVRDFQISHPDFEYEIAIDPGIVETELGSDDKPVYAGNPTTITTNGAEAFDQWYRDIDGINLVIPLELQLSPTGDGVFTYESDAFFPIDEEGFGNEGNPHNYHFTLEIHGEFTYEGGEVFRFIGDDDLFVFVNGQLAIDLGGVHNALTGEIDFDAMAAELGIEVGNTYTLDFFFAERHTTESNFRIDTTIVCFVPVGPG